MRSNSSAWTGDAFLIGLSFYNQTGEIQGNKLLLVQGGELHADEPRQLLQSCLEGVPVNLQKVRGPGKVSPCCQKYPQVMDGCHQALLLFLRQLQQAEIAQALRDGAAVEDAAQALAILLLKKVESARLGRGWPQVQRHFALVVGPPDKGDIVKAAADTCHQSVAVNCTPKVGQESQRKGCRNLWEKNCSVRN